MLIAGAVCPHPPLLIPAALGAAASAPPAEVAKVAGAAMRAVHALAAARPDLIIAVGGGPASQEIGAGAAGSLHGFGVPVTVGTGEPVLPLSLTVGRWLLEQAGLAGAGGERARRGEQLPDIAFQAVGEDTAPGVCLKLGAMLAERAPRVALLAMGDASARRAIQDPDAGDPAAQDYDEDVAEALAAADARWLGKLDPARDSELMVAGRAAWQVLAGAADGRRLHGRLLCMTAPYGVTYLVASWEEPQAG